VLRPHAPDVCGRALRLPRAAVGLDTAPAAPFRERLLTARAIHVALVSALPGLLVIVGARQSHAPRFFPVGILLAAVPVLTALASLRRATHALERVDLTDERCALRFWRRDAIVELDLPLQSLAATWRRVSSADGGLDCLTLAGPDGVIVRQYTGAGAWERADLRALYEHLAPRVARARAEGRFGP